MRGSLLKILACLLVVCFVALDSADAAQRTGSRKNRRSRPDLDKAYSLDDIMKEPKTYLEQEVFFYCRYATTANLFKNINTRFNVNEHVNLAVWPDKTILWDEKGRKNLLPTLYVPKIEPELLEEVRTLNKYELIAVHGRVLNVYAGYPWILVTKIERIQTPTDCIAQTTIEHMQSGHDALKAESGGAAARHFEQALQTGLPPEYRAKAYEQLAQAYLLENRLDKAREYLRQAVEADRSDSVLHLALADVALKMGDAAEATAHCEFALENSGRHPQVYGLMGEAKSLMKDYAKAFADLNTAAGSPGITPREKAMISVRRARIYTRACRFPDAARVYVAATEPGEPLAGEGWLHNELGLFYERQYLETGDERYLESAYSSYEEAAKLNRLDPSVLYNMTETEFRRQRLHVQPDFSLVRELINRIYQVEPDYTPARILEGRILFAEERLEEAEAVYQSVASQISDDPVSLMALAEAYIDLGRYLDAAKTVRRARRLQPWHTRVQALGKFLEETAEAIARAEAETRFDGWLNTPQQRPQPVYEALDARYARPMPRNGQRMANGRTRRPAPEYDRTIAKGLARRPVEPAYAEAPGRYEEAPRRQASAPRREYARDDYRSEGTSVRVRPGEAIRVGPNGVPQTEARDYRGYREYRDYEEYPQDIQASARPAPAPGRTMNDYPVTEVRLHADQRSEKRREEPKPLNLGYTPGSGERLRSAESEAAGREADEIRTRGEMTMEAVRRAPAGFGESPEPPRRREAGVEPLRFGEQRYESARRPESAQYREAEAEAPRHEERRRYDERSGYEERPRYQERPRYEDAREDYGRQEYRDDGYRSGAMRNDLPAERRDGYEAAPRREPDRREYRDSRDYREEFLPRDNGYRRESDREYEQRYEPEYDNGDRSPRYGMVPGSGQAYASLPLTETEEPFQQEEGKVKIPEAFTFAPDSSPVIIASVIAPYDSGRDMPVRNANVFRPLVGIRQPAEIIEKEPVDPRAGSDMAVMAPSGSGEVQRTEVRLPSSSRGVGMASDYYGPSN